MPRGRPKGSKNKRPLGDRDEVRDFVDRVFRLADPLDVAKRLLDSNNTALLIRLLEYRYGKPTEKLEMVDKTDYAQILARIRAQKALNERGS